MQPKDLLDISLMSNLDQQFIKSEKKLKFKRVVRIYHPRLGKEYWRKHFKAVKKNKKRMEKLRKKRENRERNKNGCPTRYKTYITSNWWVIRKNQFYQKYGRSCKICSSSNYIQLHHKYYADYGNEKDSDLVPLCGFHHGQVHLKIGKIKKNMRKETDNFIESLKIQAIPILN